MPKIAQDELDQIDEERANLYQAINELEQRIEKMEMHRTEHGINALSLSVAHLVEDEFAKHHEGGRSQRLAKVQVIVREAIREILMGERPWTSWRPPSRTFEPKEPII